MGSALGLGWEVTGRALGVFLDQSKDHGRVPSAEPPQFVREPERHITAEMEKVVAIPCQAKGELLPGTLRALPRPCA